MSTAVADKTSLPVLPLQNGPKIDYELVLDCVHCGLCTSACPTYVETGNEADSPRGRIYLMRGVIDGKLELDETVKEHLDLCLNCRACETACPSGVQYGKLIEPFRLHMAEKEPGRMVKSLNWVQRQMLFGIFPSRFRTRLALAPVRMMQWTGIDWLMKKTVMKLMLADAIYPETQIATARVLQKNGCEVWIPRNQGCCGALHYHAAMEPQARELAGANCTAFGMTGAEADSVDAIIINAAGCGAMIKDYEHLMHGTPQEEAARKFVAKSKDISEFLMAIGPIAPNHPLPIRATYHDACHLRHAQQVAKPPRQLLEMIPELELVPLPESELCCGAAGSYNLTQPEMAEQLGDRKTANIRATGAKAVFMGNVGCLMQVARHLKKTAPDIWVAHTIDALWASYSGEMPAGLGK
ncbi:MAG: (Fe-S)-binding protein [Planctomycetes bacterium]|nr:(Fe-S)-binding protein [Planctomycetota bacterium]